MHSSCPTSEISSIYRGVFSNSDSSSLDYSKLCRACILVVGLKISSKHYRVLDSSEHQQSYFGTAPTGLVVCNEPVAFMVAAASVGVVKTEGLFTSWTGRFRGFHGTIVEPAHVNSLSVSGVYKVTATVTAYSIQTPGASTGPPGPITPPQFKHANIFELHQSLYIHIKHITLS